MNQDFAYGVLYAAGNLVAMHNLPSIAAEIIREAGLSNWNCSGMDEYDKANLRRISNEKGMELRGL